MLSHRAGYTRSTYLLIHNQVSTMKEIKAYVRPHMLDHVIDALEATPDRPGVTVTKVEGFGHPRAGEPAELARRAKLEIVVPDEQVEAVIGVIVEHARTGRVGDGKIFVYSVDEAVRIRTGERGRDAVTVPEK